MVHKKQQPPLLALPKFGVAVGDLGGEAAEIIAELIHLLALKPVEAPLFVGGEIGGICLYHARKSPQYILGRGILVQKQNLRLHMLRKFV